MSLKLLQNMLSDAPKFYPGVWQATDAFREKFKEEWDPRVFMPFDAWMQLFCIKAKVSAPSFEEARDLQVLQSVAAWRPGQDVVRFDADLYAAIADTPLEGNLPSEVLLRLPAWAVYVEAPDMQIEGKFYTGFLVYLEQKMEEKKFELRFMFIATEGYKGPYIVSLGEWTLKKALESLMAEVDLTASELGMASPSYPGYAAGIQGAINLVLYLCSYGFSGRERTESGPIYPAPKKVKSGWRIFPPDSPKIHVLGQEIGDQIRAARKAAPAGEKEGSHTGKRPHIRRAHWHGFWSGPRKEEEKRRFDIKWLPPIAVAMKDEEE